MVTFGAVSKSLNSTLAKIVTFIIMQCLDLEFLYPPSRPPLQSYIWVS